MADGTVEGRFKAVNEVSKVITEIIKDNEGIIESYDRVNNASKKAYDDKQIKKQTVAIERNIQKLKDEEAAYEHLIKTATRPAAINELQKKLDQTRGKLKKMGVEGSKAVDDVNKKASTGTKIFKKLGAAIIAAFAISKIIGFAKASLQAYDEQQKAEARLLTAMDGRRDAQRKLITQAQEQQDVTIFAADETISAQARLASVLGDDEEAISRLIPLIQDFATAQGVDLNAATQIVGKSVASGTNTLGLYGIAIEGVAGSSERLESAITGLNKQVGGQAAAAAKVGLGPIQQLSNAWGDLQANVGKFIAKGLKPLVGSLKTVIGWFNKLIGSSPADEIRKEQAEVNRLTLSLMDASLPLKTRNKIYEELKRIAPEVLTNIDKENISIKRLGENLKEYNKIKLQEIILSRMSAEEIEIREDAADAMERQIDVYAESLGILKELTGSYEDSARLMEIQQELVNTNIKDFETRNRLIAEQAELMKKYNLVLDTGNRHYSGTTELAVAVANAEDARFHGLSSLLEDYRKSMHKAGISTGSLTDFQKKMNEEMEILNKILEETTLNIREYGKLGPQNIEGTIDALIKAKKKAEEAYTKWIAIEFAFYQLRIDLMEESVSKQVTIEELRFKQELEANRKRLFAVRMIDGEEKTLKELIEENHQKRLAKIIEDGEKERWDKIIKNAEENRKSLAEEAQKNLDLTFSVREQELKNQFQAMKNTRVIQENEKEFRLQSAEKLAEDLENIEKGMNLELLKLKRERLQEEMFIAIERQKFEGKINEQELNLFRAQLEELNLLIEESQAEMEEAEPVSLFERIFGVDPESPEGQAAIAALEEYRDKITELVGEAADNWVEATNKLVEERERQVENLEDSLDRELKLNEQGFASNVELRRKELADAKKAQAKAIEEQRKAVRARQALDTVTQVSGLVTSSVNIFEALSPLGTIGVAIAIATIATMFAAFASAKAQAARAAKFEKGGKIKGKRHSQGGEVVEVEEGERVINRRSAMKHDDLLQAINLDDNLRIAEITQNFGKHQVDRGLLKNVENINEYREEFKDKRMAREIAMNIDTDRIVDKLINIYDHLANEEKTIDLGDKIMIKKGNNTRIIKK